MSHYISITPDEAKKILSLAKEVAGEMHEPYLSVMHAPDGTYNITGDPASVIVACEYLAKLAADGQSDEDEACRQMLDVLEQLHHNESSRA